MEILAIIGLILLALLVFYVIQTLIAVQSTLKTLNMVLVEAELNLKKLNPAMNTVKNITEVTEIESEKLKTSYMNFPTKIEKQSMDSEELASWLICTTKIILNIFKKR